MKWKDKKDELDRLINIEKLSYEEIGRLFKCTGSNIKSRAKQLGIVLPVKRKVNPKETFNRGSAKLGTCKNCGKNFVLYQGTNGIYCSKHCQLEFQYKEWVKRWKNGEEDGLSGEFALSKHLRRYIFEKNECRCEKCGWGEVNVFTNKVPLQIHHIDGDCKNNKEENLQLLCPNCHSLTGNFGKRNKNATPGRSEYFGKGKK